MTQLIIFYFSEGEMFSFQNLNYKWLFNSRNVAETEPYDLCFPVDTSERMDGV